MYRFCLSLLFITIASNGWSVVEVTQIFGATSYQLKDVCLVDPSVGWAVGAPHWDQSQRVFRGTILKTTDGGETWTAQVVPVAESMQAVTFVNNNQGWAVGRNGTILHTSNGGTTWVKQSIATSDDLRGVAFVDANNGWVTGLRPIHWDRHGDEDNWDASIWHTSNGGQTWVEQTVPADASIINRITFLDTLNGWAVGMRFTGEEYNPDHRTAIYQTTNGGQTWITQYAPDFNISLQGVDFVDANNGWAVGFATRSSEQCNILRTHNGGTTWQRLEQLGTWPEAQFDVEFIDVNRGYVVGRDYVSAWGAPVYRTVDGGDTWEKVRMEKQDGEGLYGVAVTESRVIAVGDDDLVATSIDPWGPYSWPNGEELFNQKYLNAHYRFDDIFFIDHNHGWVVGSRSHQSGYWGQVILATNDGGQNWTLQRDLAPHTSSFFLSRVQFVDQNNGWAVGIPDQFRGEYKGAIVHTTDGGETWTEQGGDLASSRINDLHMFDDQSGWIQVREKYGVENFLLARTSDGGSTWEQVDTGIPAGFLNYGGIVFSDPQHGWAVAGGSTKCTVVTTVNGGSTWSEQTAGCGSWVFGGAIDFADSLNGWIVGGYLSRTIDGGNTWTTTNNGVRGIGWLQDIDMINQNEGWMVGDYGSVRRTVDGGDTWNLVTTPNPVSLRGVSFINPAQGWIAGAQGTILQVVDSPPIRSRLSSGRRSP